MQSIHLTDFPDFNALPGDAALVQDMDKVREVCNAALSLRNAENIRIRQPLQSLTIIANYANNLAVYADIIKDEVNVKEVLFQEDIEASADFQLKINFPVLGKRLPEKMKQLIPASKKGEWTQNADGLIEILEETLTKDECILELKPKDPVGTQALSSNDALVKLDLEIAEPLYLEGLARDLVRLIQQSRKEADLHVSDRIRLNILTEDTQLQTAVNNYSDSTIYSIAEQTLAASIKVNDGSEYRFSYTHTLENTDCTILFSVD